MALTNQVDLYLLNSGLTPWSLADLSLEINILNITAFNFVNLGRPE